MHSRPNHAVSGAGRPCVKRQYIRSSTTFWDDSFDCYKYMYVLVVKNQRSGDAGRYIVGFHPETGSHWM